MSAQLLAQQKRQACLRLVVLTLLIATVSCGGGAAAPTTAPAAATLAPRASTAAPTAAPTVAPSPTQPPAPPTATLPPTSAIDLTKLSGSHTVSAIVMSTTCDPALADFKATVEVAASADGSLTITIAPQGRTQTRKYTGQIDATGTFQAKGSGEFTVDKDLVANFTGSLDGQIGPNLFAVVETVALDNFQWCPTTGQETKIELRDDTLPPQAPPAGLLAAPGDWAGQTDKGWPLKLNVSASGRVTYLQITPTDKIACNGFTMQSLGMGAPDLPWSVPIVDNQFKTQFQKEIYTGKFTSAKAATGTYDIDDTAGGCAIKAQPLKISGTWQASLP
jgi:hypothetical protein